jgi:ribonucleotide monophosphatase NagD (HAD superfamily)
VTFYGKPHLPIFHALETSLATNRLLMVGDSLEHDIAGAAAAGWDTLLVQGGLYANAFADGDHSDVVKALAKEKAAPLPTYMISEVQ